MKTVAIVLISVFISVVVSVYLTIRFTDNQQTADPTTVRVLAIGQSNIEGRYGPAISPYDLENELRAWNWSQDIWVPAELGSLPFAGVVRIKDPANNLAYVFAGKLAMHCQVDVDTVLLASGGKRIEYFLPNYVLEANGWVNEQNAPPFGASLADEILGSTGDAALALQTSEGLAYDVVLVHQGEANNEDILENAEPYLAKLRALVAELRLRKLVSEDTPILFGGINPDYRGGEAHRIAIEQLANEGLGVVDWRGIEDVRSVSGESNNHATGNGLTELGLRYFEEYMRLVRDCPT